MEHGGSRRATRIENSKRGWWTDMEVMTRVGGGVCRGVSWGSNRWGFGEGKGGELCFRFRVNIRII